MTAPLFNIGGLASGLDTSSIIDQLMAIERNPVTLMERRKAASQEKVDAWSAVTSAVSSLRTSVDGLRDLRDFDELVAASSSDPDAVEVAVRGGGTVGSTSFNVTELARSHQVASASSFSSTSDQVGAGTFTITVGGVAHDFTTSAGTTLENLAADIDEAGIGVSANALRLDASTVRLVLTADETGADAAFTAGGTQASLADTQVVQEGVDALLTVGSGDGALEVRRSSNTITDLIDGIEVTLRSTTTEPVRIEASRDVDATVEQVEGFVGALNRVMATIVGVSRFDAEGDADGPLIGDSSLRQLESQLVGEVTGLVDSLVGDRSYAATIGLEYSIDREFTLDTEKLRTALEEDYEGVMSFFARDGESSDPRLRFGFGTDATQPGGYDVVVTQAATLASRAGAGWTAPGGDVTFTLTNGDASTDLTVVGGDSLQAAITRINDALDEAGFVHLRASDNAGALQIGALRYGSGGSFTVTGSGALGLDGSAVGVDAAGTIDGVAAEGTGRTLRSTSGGSEGLGVTVAVTEAEVTAGGGSVDLGTMSYSRGLMGEISELLSRWEGTDGMLARASAEHEGRIEVIDDQIDRFEDRLAIRERTLRAQFTAMESMLADLQSQSSYLASAIAGLPRPSSG